MDGLAEVAVERLEAPIARHDLDALSELLIDAVNGNASIGFPAGVSKTEADDFWVGVEGDVAAGRAVLLGARLDGRLAATAQLRFPPFPNGRNRAEVAKVLAHSSVRRRGLATALMGEIERAAMEAGRGLLFLDTETGSPAEQLYGGLGWTRAGMVPDFAYRPDGELRPTSFFYKILD
ncbi:MAG: GNAT family N-acetyltransferase [Chloroflexi bacterium]|nr:MAG: GNAT family N-acetyltransferase [Chloroflexota bacterium]